MIIMIIKNSKNTKMTIYLNRTLLDSLQEDNMMLRTQLEDQFKDRTARDKQIELISIQVATIFNFNSTKKVILCL